MESKKIVPFFLVVSSILILLYYILFAFDLSGIIYAILMPLFLLVPPIVYKIFRIKPVPRLSNNVFVFVLFAYGIGIALHKYRDWDPYYDKAVHFFAGYLFAMIGICAFYYMKREKKIDPYHDLPTSLVLAGTFSVTIGAVWEIFEFIVDLLFHTDPQRVADTGVTDTMLDLIADTGGALLAIFFLWLFFKKGNSRGLMVKTFEEFCNTNILHDK